MQCASPAERNMSTPSATYPHQPGARRAQARLASLRQEWRRSEARWGYIFAAATLLPIIIFSDCADALGLLFCLHRLQHLWQDHGLDWPCQLSRKPLPTASLPKQLAIPFNLPSSVCPRAWPLAFLIAVLLNRRFRGHFPGARRLLHSRPHLGGRHCHRLDVAL